ncbi:YigZ family protein [Algicola sagamiensis]|uniref:YigZ family protein n=1 Tax=Algicola sagamiensis TaxID=163869 RepID=UPI000371E92D|nr:YigZ family protein [Algicola sagamiensis]
MSEYQIPQAPCTTTIEVKRSQFICHIAHTPDVVSARQFVAQMKEEYPDASHNCSAFVAGAPKDSQCYGFSDDGEPSGCAGRPMLKVLQGQNIGEICVVVTRYFGGIKLGTGGMARAYADAVKEGLRGVTWQTKKPQTVLYLAFPFEYESTMRYLVKSHDAHWLETEYGTQVDCHIEIEEEKVKIFLEQSKEKTNAKLIINENGTN